MHAHDMYHISIKGEGHKMRNRGVVNSLPFDVMGYESILMTQDGKRVEDPEPVKPATHCGFFQSPIGPIIKAF